MGTTCRTYLSRTEISLTEAYKALQKIDHYFCLGDKKTLRLSTKIGDVDSYKKFKNEFGSKNTIMVNFKVNSPKAIYNFISDPTLYKKSWFFIHLLNPPISWAHSSSYWIDLDNQKELFKLRLNLPSASGIDACKEELVKMISFLSQNKILNVSSEKAIDLANQLLKPRHHRHDSSEVFHEFKFLASGLSTVMLCFQKEQFDSFGGYLKMAERTATIMDEYYSSFNSYIQGTFICNEASEALNILKQIEFIELEINVNFDLRKHAVSDIQSFYDKFKGNDFDIRLENFDWLFSDISFEFIIE